jgi:glycosyltransferase involved in cell wall biosynthesis
MMPRRARVLQVALSLTPGGTERLVVEICRRIAPEFRATVCCLDEAGEWAEDLRNDGIEVIALRREPGFRPSVGRRIARIAADRGIRLAHCHQYSPFVYGRIAAWWMPELKLVYTEHGRLSDAPPSWKRRMVNPVLSRFDGTAVAVSHELRDYMIDARFAADRLQVVHNGIEAGARPSLEDRNAARARLGIKGDRFVAMTVARLDPVKDLVGLLDGFAKVRVHVPDARLVVVGDGPERARIEQRARKADLAGSVILTGYQSNVRALLPAADVYVSNSISEGVSITILEAMAAAVPVVATSVGGTPEVLDGGVGGTLVPARSPDRLAAAIVDLARAVGRRARMGDEGRRRIETAFTIDRMVDDYTRIYRQHLDITSCAESAA